MNRQVLTIRSPRQLEIREESLPPPAADEVLVETVCSGVSAGTEMLLYRGEFPQGLPDRHDPFSSDLRYPVRCGYACIGRVAEPGAHVDPGLAGRLVFCFQPHATHFISSAGSLIPLPKGQTPESAAFLANMETAVNLVQDGAPILGERVLVMGQGVVGLLVASLLREFPLGALAAADSYPLRREASPAVTVLDPSEPDFIDQARSGLEEGADLTFELSGSP
ncbi:MAG: zinc-dependent alcohol dehydrogenase, partial [Bacteroidota bacterium]